MLRARRTMSSSACCSARAPTRTPSASCTMPIGACSPDSRASTPPYCMNPSRSWSRRAARASVWLLGIGFEQVQQLLGGFARGLAGTCSRHPSPTAACHASPRHACETLHRLHGTRLRQSERLEHLLGHLEARNQRFADDVAHLEIHESEGMLAVAGARENLQMRKVLARSTPRCAPKPRHRRRPARKPRRSRRAPRAAVPGARHRHRTPDCRSGAENPLAFGWPPAR